MMLYLARHGRSLGQGLFLGQSDPALSDEGRRQSEALADALRHAGVERIVCSRLARSTETAEIVGRRLTLPIEPDSRLNEVGYGLWDGLAWNEIERRWPADAARKLADWWGGSPPGGETRDDFQARVTACWKELSTVPLTTLLVGHAGVNALLSELAESGGDPDWERITRFQQDYGAVRVITVL